MIRKSLLLHIFLTANFLFEFGLANAQSFSVFSISDISLVDEDGFKLPMASCTISLFGIRGEIISTHQYNSL